MSLKRMLNPAESEGHGGGNLWRDDEPRVRPRITEPDHWCSNVLDDNLGWEPYPQETLDPWVMMVSDHIEHTLNEDTMYLDPGLSQQPFYDSSIFSGPATTATSMAFEVGENDAENVEISPMEIEPSDAGIQICYGMLVREKVRLVGRGEDIERRISKLRETDQWWHSFCIREPNQKDELFLTFADGTDLGYLSEKMKRALKSLVGLAGFELEAWADLNSILAAIRHAKKASDAAFRVNINIYGGKDIRDEVGKELSDQKLFLQHPDMDRPGVPYDNPHFLRLDEFEDSDVEEEQDVTEEELVEVPFEQHADFEETIMGVYQNLRRAEELHRLDGSENLDGTLFAHQEEALDFMVQRETGNITPGYRLWQSKSIDGEQLFCHAITNHQQRDEPDESGGGILADEMGMGKSLTTLVLIGKTIKDARQWVLNQKSLPTASLGPVPCRATLVIVPQQLLINTWMREIENHLRCSLKVMVYHGRARKALIDEIDQYDIVITTYNTLAKEHGEKLLGQGKSPLHNLSWYRVVLDEAHWIRRRTTTFHKSVGELQAKSRWCLSGTPIQNSLGDLASLLSFIQFRPFHDTRNFRHWIGKPFEEKEARQKAIGRLTTLLDAVCLRRTIERVQLPGQKEQTRVVRFTETERTQYDATHAALKRIIEQQVGQIDPQQSTIGMFQVFLQLRSLCNHGTYQHSLSWVPNVVDEEALHSVRSLSRTSLERCQGCSQPLPIIPRERRRKHVENCNHFLCDDCCRSIPLRPGPDGKSYCPLCEFLRSSRSEGCASLESKDAGEDSYLLKEGVSSKMQMLLSDVQSDLEGTKSIIFSCWTRTLDLIARHLRGANIKFERIDGRVRVGQRQKILDSFNGTARIRVLIMTTSTGAFGLNLQAVNRVFLVEPQWNPSVESQAIARAIRLGQQQQVLVTRYFVEDSIEKEMISQQTQKLKISKMDF